MKKLPEQSDIELISHSCKGDSFATEELLKRYKGLVCKIARNYNLQSGGDTEDLIQEGTVGFLKAIREYDASKNVAFSAFASVCINNKVRDAVRGFLRCGNVPLNDAISISDTDGEGDLIVDELSTPVGSDPLSKYQDAERTAEFYRTLEQIATPIQCAVLKLYLDGASYKEISQKLNISTKTVDNTLAAVKNKIKKCRSQFE